MHHVLTGWLISEELGVLAEHASKECPFCHGSGRCTRCGGSGLCITHRGWLKLKRIVACDACGRSGECQLCHGRGALAQKA